jgi:hypothetical protein
MTQVDLVNACGPTSPAASAAASMLCRRSRSMEYGMTRLSISRRAAVHGDGNRCHSPHHCRPAFCRRIGLQMTWWNGDRRDVSDCNSAVALRRRLADRMLRAFQFKKRKPRRPKATHCTHAHERECPSQKGSAEFKLRVAAGGGDSCRQTRRPLRVLLYRR